VTATLTVGRAKGAFSHKIGAYLALTDFQRDLLVRGGLPAEKITVVPNFLEPDPGAAMGPRSGFLFVGRLSEDKGVPALLRASALAPRLVRVAGEGPMSADVASAASIGDLQALGHLAKAAVFDELGRAQAMILPSVWFEGLPVSVLEAYAKATPVIASRIGSLAEVVEDGVTGLLADPDDPNDLADRLRWADQHKDEMRQMGSNARLRYETTYRGGMHLAALLATYQRLVEANGAGDA
jgi:glycosyltransferase involved in cell wall biosynthesis